MMLDEHDDANGSERRVRFDSGRGSDSEPSPSPAAHGSANAAGAWMRRSGYPLSPSLLLPMGRLQNAVPDLLVQDELRIFGDRGERFGERQSAFRVDCEHHALPQ
jgi:hypothetical protein